MEMYLMKKLNLMKDKMEEGAERVERIERIERVERQVEKTESKYRVDD